MKQNHELGDGNNSRSSGVKTRKHTSCVSAPHLLSFEIFGLVENALVFILWLTACVSVRYIRPYVLGFDNLTSLLISSVHIIQRLFNTPHQPLSRNYLIG